MDISFGSSNVIAIGLLVAVSVAYIHGNFIISLCPTPHSDTGFGLHKLAACCSEDGAVQCDPYE